MSKKLRVLLADDSRFFRAIESQFLQKTPVDIIEADDCALALSMVRNEKPDLVYVAFSLPKDGGDVCCKAIKSDPEILSVPVVIVCDPDHPEQVDIARRSGCDAYLIKPLDMHSFLQIGRQFITEIREHRQSSFFPVVISANGEEYKGKCLDLSGGGMFIESQAEIPAGSQANMSFKLPNRPAASLTCSVKVMWQNRKPNPMKPHYPHGLGIMFVELPASIHKEILRLSDKNSSR
jgi:CheY-like chemotaxis protein